MIKSVGAGLCVAVALAGCSGTVPGSRSSPNRFTGPVETPNPTVTVTVAGKTVFVSPSATGPAAQGGGCEVAGQIDRTAQGRQLRCVKAQGASDTVWVLDKGAYPDGTVRPGEQCPARGAVGTVGRVEYRCVPGRGPNDDVWRPAA
ncbi:hypothetical protein LO762_29990 [Actinocorallia sp. API 0066]|uniref:hypothetical protein n=1 Tax=Actinocorallia sp. API 0066 TaxID=2896846 RepID=UPI001E2FAC1C|nr:hypothetical protein [Actinocorallia sp. API 0066]MCD0453380.1 hypothetical protein [Actinocorallia sp. API 0066]